jgi:mycofactocin system glycosyltransferase
MPDRPTTHSDAPLPAGTRLTIAPGTRRLAPGLVAGGSPWRILRLTAAGDRWLDRWQVGQVVPEGLGVRRLAARLIDAGLAWTRPPPDPNVAITVVMPCRDRAAGLAVTLQALEADLDVIVVDDGSSAPEATRLVAADRPRTNVILRTRSGGPGAARNEGWRRVRAETGAAGPGAAGPGPGDTAEKPVLVAFLDTDCIPPPGWWAALAGHFRDPRVGAAAPRIESFSRPGAAGWLHHYERARSPLDLGPLPAPVRPRSSVPYVPSAALVVRLSALVEMDGFDEELMTGEDVDLVWRLDEAGWRVRYDPGVVVGHPVRPHFRGWLAQRVGYGRSAAPLAARHGPAVAPLTISRWSALVWLLAGLGHPVAGATVAVFSTARLAEPRRGRGAGPDAGGRGPWPRAAIARLALRGHLLAGLGLADAVRRAWWPLAAVAALACRRSRPALAVIAIVPPLIERYQRRPTVGPLTWVVLRLVDDLAYGTGVWAGAWRRRDARCLYPGLA